jgi:hypothetical protein
MLRGVDCHYVHSVEGRSSFSTCQPASTSGSTLHLHTNIQPTTPLLPCNTNPPKFGIPAWRSIDSRELELMHHWCTRTCYSFTPSLTEHFRDEVGKEALRYDFLMNALLALTSFHVATEVGNAITARSHTAAALQYHNQALSGLREVLPDITASTCNPIFVSSAMLAICAVISPFLHTDMGEMKSVPDAVQPLMNIMRGTGSIIDASHQWLLQGPLSRVVRSAMTRDTSIVVESFPVQELRRLNDMIIDSSSDTLNESGGGSSKHQVYESAIQKLEETSRKGVSMLPWLMRIDPGFMDELRKEHPMAVAVFMYWGVLLHRLDNMWWSKYSGKRLVRRLSATLDGCGGTWDQISEWCRVQVELSPLSGIELDTL